MLAIDNHIDGSHRICHAAACAGISVIVIDVPHDDHTAADALSAGAQGLIFADAPDEQLLDAITMVRRGLVWAPISTVLSALGTHATQPEDGRRLAACALLERLSQRERDVLKLVVAGLGNKEVADRLAISTATVKVHLTHIFRKLGVHGRVELAATYYNCGAPAETNPPGVMSNV
jgi:RNA polymerase sigma factor (sigma-70 family)